jgi:MFS family permease
MTATIPERKIDRLTPAFAAAANILPGMLVATLGIALADISAALCLSEPRAGSLFSMLFVTAALASAVAGHQADKRGRKTVLVAGVVLLTAGLLLLSLSRSYAAMLIPLALAGVGYGLTPPSLFGLMADLLPHKRGLAASLVAVAYGAGVTAGSLMASLIIAAVGWRAAFFADAAVGAGVLALVVTRLRHASTSKVQIKRTSYVRALTGTVGLLVVAEFCGSAAFWSAASWTATVLRSAKGLTLGETGVIMGLWGLAPTLGSLLLGILSDRWSRRTVISRTAFMGSVVSFVVYALLATPVPLGIGLFILGFLKATVPALVVALAQDTTDREAAGTASGLIMSTHYVAAVVAPLAAGQLIAATGNMATPLILTSALPLVLYGGVILAVRK